MWAGPVSSAASPRPSCRVFTWLSCVCVCTPRHPVFLLYRRWSDWSRVGPLYLPRFNQVTPCEAPFPHRAPLSEMLGLGLCCEKFGRDVVQPMTAAFVRFLLYESALLMMWPHAVSTASGPRGLAQPPRPGGKVPLFAPLQLPGALRVLRVVVHTRDPHGRPTPQPGRERRPGDVHELSQGWQQAGPAPGLEPRSVCQEEGAVRSPIPSPLLVRSRGLELFGPSDALVPELESETPVLPCLV